MFCGNNTMYEQYGGGWLMVVVWHNGNRRSRPTYLYSRSGPVSTEMSDVRVFHPRPHHLDI